MNSLKENIKDDKKAAVLEAGIKVLREKGVSSTSMNDIIRESGLSKGGVYHYFPSKNDLLIELWQYFFEIYAVSNLSALQSNPSLKSKKALAQIDVLMQQHEANLDDMGKDLRFMMDLFVEATHNEALKKVFKQQYQLIFTILKSLIETAQQQGDIRKDVDSHLLSASLLAIFDGFSIMYQILDNTENYPRMALSSVRLLLSSVTVKSRGNSE